MAVQDFNHTSHIYNTRSADILVPIIIDMLHPASVLDVGCGNGSWLKVLIDKGLEDVVGVDGHYVKKEDLLIPQQKFMAANLEEPLALSRKFDLALCLEVAEHLDQRHAATLVQSLVHHSNHIVFSAAIPGQQGENHINEQPPAYWQELFQEQGYHTYDVIRPRIWENDSIFWWYRQNIFLASKDEMFPGMDENIPHLVHPELLNMIKEEYAEHIAYHARLDQSPLYLWKKFLKSLKTKIG